MKGCVPAALFVVLAGLLGYNMWTVHTLRAEVAELKRELQREKQTSTLLGDAMRALQDVREALAGPTASEAAGSLEKARKALAEAAQSAGKHAEPALRWLQEQARALAKEVETRTDGSHEP